MLENRQTQHRGPKMYALLILLALISPTAAFAMTFDLFSTGGNCNGCEWIGAEGTIDDTSLPNFLLALKKVDGGYPGLRIVLNSPGGSLANGIKLGEFIRSKRFHTEVGRTVSDNSGWKETAPGKCASACAFAFLGGVDRDAKGGEIGVHQFYRDIALKDPSAKIFDAVDLSSQQLISGMLIEYVDRMGIHPRFVSIASNVAPTNIEWLTIDQVRDLKVAYRPDSFEPWQIEPYGSGLVAFSKTQDKSKTATLFCGKDRAPKLLLDWPANFDSAHLNEALQRSGIIEVGKQRIPLPMVKASVDNGRAKVTVDLKSAAGEFTATTTQSLGVGLDSETPRYLLHAVAFSLEVGGLHRAARLAFRNCI